MIESFSNSYYIGQFYVLASSSDRAEMCMPDFEVISEAYSGDGQPVLKLDSCHFTVFGAGDVPLGSIEIPEELLSDLDVEANPHQQKNVFIAKNEQIAKTLGLGTW